MLRLVVVAIGLSVVYAQSSPCPEIFKYVSDQNGVYGRLKIQPSESVQSITVKINLTVAARLPTNYVGSIEPLGVEMQLLESYNRGSPISYRVNFPVISPLPKITSLTVNNKVLCYGPGDVAGANQYVTMITLEHILYYRGGSAPSVVHAQNAPAKPAAPQPVQPAATQPTPTFILEGFPDDQEINIIIAEAEPITTTKKPPPPEIDWEGPSGPYWERPPPDRHGPPHRHGKPPPEGGRHPPPHHEWNRPPPNWDRPPPQKWEEDDNPPPREKPAHKPTTIKPTPKEPEPTEEYQEEPETPKPKPTRPSMSDRTSGDTCGKNGLDSVPLVYRGTSYERGKWPWLVALFKRKYTGLSYICAGTLVSDRHVVTAAHCMHRKNSYTASKDIVVRIGVYNLDDWADEAVVIRNLENANIHESYNSTTLANDILVLTLDRPVEFNLYIKAACLWSGITDLNAIVESSGVVAGWGASEAGPAGRGEPRMVRMPIVSTTTCRASKLEFHKLTSSKTLCAGDRNGAGPCLGDSGGGLYILDSNTGRWRLRGIVSISLWTQSGEDTCNLNDYIVFTDTAQYLPWIRAAIAT
ncbi:serine protease gd-like isoform X2 [Aricia agestis]|uniref:serine protease gd-like isoform X2 n=1 Tax=Aricia agestis TaxID=91739 RepID=UPI001C201F08|nr:serine protease gd-like isoform X2 [Aricia agestis]